MDKETEERINRPIPFQEYPKMLHHPDGRYAIVSSAREQSALGNDWYPNPMEASKISAERDAADEKRLAAQIAKGKA